MKPAAFEYRRARSAGEAISALAEARGPARPIAGGQSLGPLLNLRLARPALLVDVRTCSELRGYVEEDDAVVLGAAITHAEIEDGAVPDPCRGWLAAAARGIAYRAVRNRGTLGGSLVHADPAADWPAILLALGAEAIVEGPRGPRAVPLAGFVEGPFRTALAPDELLLAVRVPRPPDRARFGLHKLSAKRGEFALALAAVLVDPAAGTSRMVIGAIEGAPLVVESEALPSGLAESEALVARRLPHLSGTARRLPAIALARAVAQAAAEDRR